MNRLQCRPTGATTALALDQAVCSKWHSRPSDYALLEEAEHCQKLAFMVAGEIVAEGTPSQIKASQPGKLIEISTDNTQKAAQVVRQTLDAWKVAIFADSLHLNLENPDQELPKFNNNCSWLECD